jgi:hypothetical protein
VKVIDFDQSDLGEYFAARRRLIASGLRHHIPLGNTRYCPGCEAPVDPIDLSCDCYTPRNKEAPMTDPAPNSDDIQTEDDARAYFEALGVEITIHD